MIKDLWINLPVKDVTRAKNFYSAAGFSFNTRHGNTPDSISLLVGNKNVVVMLFAEQVFAKFTGIHVADTSQGSEVLLSIDAESRQEVDDWVAKIESAGGIVTQKPGESQGWLYGCGFSDPDGHRWNVLYMDMEKMPK